MRDATPGEASYDVVVVGGGHNGLVAAASVQAFRGVDAYLSRYSYLVSLLPEQIVADLGLRLELRSRSTASYTPVERDGRHGGLYVERSEGAATEASFAELTGSGAEYATSLRWPRSSRRRCCSRCPAGRRSRTR